MMRIVTFVWLVVLCFLSIAPFHVKLHLRTMGRMHNIGHALAFFITVLLLAWDARTVPVLLLRAGLVFCVALALEWVEFLKYYIRYEWSDVFIDGIGIMLGLVVLGMVLLQRASGTNRTA
jgi:hypothetical protein